jgi:sugar/nucleoside kinase (ribokinase family)
MTVDLAVIGSSFLDLTFEGIPGLPLPGQEVLCRQLHFSPGGSAMTAIGGSRLGLRTALVSPIGRDTAGAYLRLILEREGVEWPGPEVERSAVTAVLPFAEDRAMATFNPMQMPTPAQTRAVQARAVVLSIRHLDLTPQTGQLYVVTGYPEVTGEAGGVPEDLHGAHAVITAEPEALRLTGATDAEEAVLKLGVLVRTAVVTRGPNGAVAAHDGEVTRAPGLDIVGRDTTGAGDLFVSAYVWADLLGAPLRDRLAWANLYAGISVQTYTPIAGAVSRAELLERGHDRGLTLEGLTLDNGREG